MKKIILGGLILSSLFVGITQATQATITTGNYINDSAKYTRYDLDLPGEFGYVGNSYFNNEIYADGSFENSQLLFYTTNNTDRYFTFGWISGQPYGIAQFRNSTLYSQGYMSNLCETTSENILQDCQYIQGDNPTFNTTWEQVDKNFSPDKFIVINSCNTSVICYAGMFCFQDTTQDRVLCWDYNISWGSQFIMSGGNLVSTMSEASQGVRYNIFDEGTPFTAGGGGEDEPTITGYDPETGLPCATIDTIIKYETNYNTGICYSTPFTLSGSQIIQITPKSFTELRSGYNDFRNDINKYHNYCTPPATNEACQNAFGNEEQKRNLINKIPEGLNTKVVYDYCHMYLTYSGDTNICEIDDEELWSASYEDLINAMNEITITQPGTGSVFDNYKDQTARNIITALPSVYYKITSIFRNNTGVKGIIPSYITWIIILIVLFKLFKK